MAQPHKSGGTRREYLEAAQRATRRPMPCLSMQCPTGGLMIWNYFCELSNARSPGKPISFSEIKAWSELTCAVLTPHEVGLIRQLDSAFLAPETKTKTK